MYTQEYTKTMHMEHGMVTDSCTQVSALSMEAVSPAAAAFAVTG